MEYPEAKVLIDRKNQEEKEAAKEARRRFVLENKTIETPPIAYFETKAKYPPILKDIKFEKEHIEYKKMSSLQKRYLHQVADYKCQICEKAKYDLVIDHDHKSGLVRGILCGGCNVTLGWFEMDFKMADKLRAYLDKGPFKLKDHEISKPTQ